MTNPTSRARTTSRRSFLRDSGGLAAALSLAGLPTSLLAAEPGVRFGPAQPFDFDWLIGHAREMARRPYDPPPRPAPDVVQRIDYDAHGKLRTRPEAALWSTSGGVYPITFVHMGRFFPKTVRLHAIEGGEAREIVYSPDYFTMPEDHVARQLPADASAFAGFWVQESRRAGSWPKREPWVTFAGASYFRAVGDLGQVGMSARGIALNVADPEPEEFPDFTHFWFESTKNEGDPQIVYALLDGASIAGAYRFKLTRTRGVIIEIENHLFPRRDIHRLGVAPLTSMFWYGEYPSSHAEDWRPEVHDTDGLALWNGAGERIWRPINNPPRIVTSSFFDINPKGFGLSQRDRNYDHYLDGVNYHLRPSCWIEPLGDWGRGAVQLVEIPTDDEIYDNVVAFWLPEQPVKGGDSLTFAYRMHWAEFEPFYPALDLARCVATRIGRGGQPGQPRPKGVVKFAVEFDGASLGSIPWGVRPEVVVTASRGGLSRQASEPVWYTPRWLATFDLAVDGNLDPIELRMFMAMDGKPLTETWLYQYHPVIRG